MNALVQAIAASNGAQNGKSDQHYIGITVSDTIKIVKMQLVIIRRIANQDRWLSVFLKKGIKHTEKLNYQKICEIW